VRIGGAAGPVSAPRQEPDRGHRHRGADA